LQNFYKQVSDPYINQSPKHNPQVPTMVPLCPGVYALKRVNVDLKAECNQLNLAHIYDQKQTKIKNTKRRN